MAIGVAPGLIRQIARQSSLGLPTLAEAEMQEQDTDPDQEDQRSNDRYQPVKDCRGTSVDHHQCNAGKGRCDHYCYPWNASTVGLADPFGCPAIVRQRQQHSGGDIEIRVGGRHNRREDDRVHVICSTVHTGLDEYDREGCVLGSARAVGQATVFIVDNAGEEEDRENVKEGDSDQDCVDSFWDVLMRVARLCCSDTREFRATIGESDRDQDREEGFEASLKGCSRAVPVLDTISGSTNCASVDEDAADNKDNDGHDLEDTEPVFNLTVDFLRVGASNAILVS